MANVNSIDFLVKNGLVVSTTATVLSKTNSVSTTTGALQVAGGVGIAKDINVGGSAFVKSTAAVSGVITALSSANSISTNSGALQVIGGVGIGQDVNIGGTATVDGTVFFNSDARIKGDLYVDGTQFIVNSQTIATGDKTLVLSTASTTALSAAGSGVFIGSTASAFISWSYDGSNDWVSSGGIKSTNTLTVLDSTISISTTTGALVVKGGAGIGGDLRLGGKGYLNGGVSVSNSASSTSTAFNNSIYTAGGLWVGKDLSVQGQIIGVTTATITQVFGNSGQFFGDNSGFDALYAGIPTGFTQLPSTVLQLTADINDYVQTNFQNINNGPAASVDWVATAANGTNGSGFVDMGIASGTWDGTQAYSLGDAIGPNDAYLYNYGGTGVGQCNLVLGAVQSDAAVKFVVGGFGASYITAQFNAPYVNAVSTTSGSLVVHGGVGIAQDLRVGGSAYISGDLYVDGTQFVVNSQTLATGDKTLVLSTASTTALSATNSGLIVGSTSTPYASFLYDGANYWKSNIGVNVLSTANAVSSSTGALHVAGGVGIEKDLYVGGTIYAQIAGQVTAGGANGAALNADNMLVNDVITNTEYYLALAQTKDGTYSPIDADSYLNYNTTNNLLTAPSMFISDTTNSTDTTVGALVVNGGVGIAGDVHVGGTITATQILVNGYSVSTASGITVYNSGTGAQVALSLSFGNGTTSTVVGGQSQISSTDTLQSVTDRGNSTTNAVLVNNTIQAGSLGLSYNLWMGGSLTIAGSAGTVTVLSCNGVSFQSQDSHNFIGGETFIPQSTGLGLTFGNTYYVTAVLSATRFILSNTPNGSPVGNAGVLTIAGAAGKAPALKVAGDTHITTSTNSTGTTTGALVVDGGVGIGGNLNVGGTLNVNGAGTSTIAGDLIINGTVVGGGIRTYSGAIPPTAHAPTPGDIWYNTGNDAIYRYTDDGAGHQYWIDITGPVVLTQVGP